MSDLHSYLNEVWYGEREGSWLRPLGAMYGMTMVARQAAYRRGWRRVYRAPCPVLIVGNRTVGGTGKTPLVIELVRRLAARGARPGVISRGYGGRVTRESAQRVERDSVALDVGDEPLLIARRSAVPVAVCPDRRLACEAVLTQGVDVIVSDDGLQHLALARDAAINVIDGARGEGNGRCLPAGPLRTPPSASPPVDLTLVNGVDMTLRPTGVRASDNTLTPLASWSGRRVHAVAGIGRPERFFETLRSAGLEVVGHPRPDHAPLSAPDLRFDEDLPVLITEKDSVKLSSLPDSVYDVPVSAALSAEASAAVDALLSALCETYGL